MKRIFIGSLPSSTTEESLTALFSQYGKVRSIELVKDLFSGHCKGFGFLEMEGHEARIAVSELNGRSFEGNLIRVKFEDPRSRGKKSRRRQNK